MAAAVAMASTSAGAQTRAPQLVVTSAVADANSGTLTISGQNFAVFGGTFATRPFVTLDLVPLDVRVATDTVILAAAPSGAIPPATYLLTVSRGPTAAENASLEVIVETVTATSAAKESTSWSDSLPPVTAGGPAAQVGDRAITIEDVDREWRRTNPSGYLQVLRELYEARRQVLTTMVGDEVLVREAAARNMSVDALLKEEVPKRQIAMPDSAVISMFLSLGTNARGASLDQMRPALRAWLERHSELELAKISFIEELKNVSTRADVVLDAPRVQVERTLQDIALGPPTAPVELIAFGDFQSEDYARFAQVFSRIRETFGDRIRLTFKNLPTRGPDSVMAAEAGLCANAQGKFWLYHDALVAPGPVNAERITQSAVAAGVKIDPFGNCVERREFRDAIQTAIDTAGRYGIHASPSFLVNGRLAPAPPPFLAPYDYFKLLIEEELGRLASNRGK
jgi:protein-disulfide isomerase